MLERRKQHPGSRQVRSAHATHPPCMPPTSARLNGTESLPPHRFRLTPQPRPAPPQAAPPSTGPPHPRRHTAGHLGGRSTGGQAAQDPRRRRRVDGHAAQHHALTAARACPAVHVEDAVEEPRPGKPASARQLRATVRPAESQLLLRHGLPRGTLSQSDHPRPKARTCRQNPAVDDQVRVRRRNQRRQAPDELLWREHERRRAIGPRTLQTQCHRTVSAALQKRSRV